MHQKTEITVQTFYNARPKFDVLFKIIYFEN